MFGQNLQFRQDDGDYGRREKPDGDSGREPFSYSSQSNPGQALHQFLLEKHTASLQFPIQITTQE